MITDQRTSAGEANQASNVTEQAIAALWSDILDTTEQPSATDNFFALGGDSMAMVTLEFRIKEEFSVELPIGAVFSAPTLRELSALVDAARRASRSPSTQPAEPSAT